MNIHIDYSTTKKCCNPKAYVVCYKCNMCGRFDKEKMWQDRYRVYADMLAEQLEALKDEDFQSNLQQTNIAKNIVYFGKKLQDAIKHINFEEEEE